MSNFAVFLAGEITFECKSHFTSIARFENIASNYRGVQRGGGATVTTVHLPTPGGFWNVVSFILTMYVCKFIIYRQRII